MSDLFYIFLYPNANHKSIQWYSDVLDSKWLIILLSLFLIYLVFLFMFYFLSKPNKRALFRFWMMTIILIIIAPLLTYAVMYSSRNDLLRGGGQWTYDHTIYTLLFGFVSGLELFVIVLVAFLIISLFPTRWQIRAMRRYPFKIIK